jgi:hypothetical protein
VARQIRDGLIIAWVLQHLALLAVTGCDARRAAQLLGYVDAQYTALGMPRDTTEPGAKLGVHYHVGTVRGYTISGHWRYLEHDWDCEAGKVHLRTSW